MIVMNEFDTNDEMKSHLAIVGGVVFEVNYGIYIYTYIDIIVFTIAYH